MALDNADIIANPYIARHESIFNECSRSNIEEPLFQAASNGGWADLEGGRRLCLVGMGVRGAGGSGDGAAQWGAVGCEPAHAQGMFCARATLGGSERAISVEAGSVRTFCSPARRDPPPGRCDAPPTDQHTPHPTPTATRRSGTVRCTVYGVYGHTDRGLCVKLPAVLELILWTSCLDTTISKVWMPKCNGD